MTFADKLAFAMFTWRHGSRIFCCLIKNRTAFETALELAGVYLNKQAAENDLFNQRLRVPGAFKINDSAA